jgi:hypothetical protein
LKTGKLLKGYGFGSGSETGDATYQKSSKSHKNKQFDKYDVKKPLI